MHSLNTLAGTLLSAIPFGVSIVDDNLNLLYVNQRIEQRVGAGATGRRCYDVYSDNHKQCPGCPVNANLHCRDGDSLEIEGMFGGRTIQITYTTVDLNGGRVLLEVMQDITQRKLAEDTVRQTLEALRVTSEKTVNALARMVERLDPYIAGHQRRVAMLACAIAREIGLSEEQISAIGVAGTLHDIGKIDMPVSILSKRARLSEIEIAIVKTHPRVGYDIVRTIPFPQSVAQIVLQHHERINGSGYPQGLTKDNILPEARVLAVADVVEAIVSPRPHRPDMGSREILDEISEKRGILYDPMAVDAYFRLFPEK